jgi:hypothetical protein
MNMKIGCENEIKYCCLSKPLKVLVVFGYILLTWLALEILLFMGITGYNVYMGR